MKKIGLSVRVFAMMMFMVTSAWATDYKCPSKISFTLKGAPSGFGASVFDINLRSARVTPALLLCEYDVGGIPYYFKDRPVSGTATECDATGNILSCKINYQCPTQAPINLAPAPQGFNTSVFNATVVRARVSSALLLCDYSVGGSPYYYMDMPADQSCEAISKDTIRCSSKTLTSRPSIKVPVATELNKVKSAGGPVSIQKPAINSRINMKASGIQNTTR